MSFTTEPTEHGSSTWTTVRSPHRATVPEAVALARAYCSKPGNGVGGSLHIVLEDGNTKRQHVEGCVKWARENGDVEGEALALMLLRMTRTQRIQVCARTWINLPPE
jgi:hypothetical protein